MRLKLTAGVVFVLVLVACGDDGPSAGGAEPVGTQAAEQTATTIDEAHAARAQEALERVEGYFAAVNSGDIDGMEAARGVTLTEAEVRNWQFHALLTAEAPWVAGACEVTSKVGDIVSVECPMENTDPVFVATGASQVIAPFTLIGDELRDQGWRPLGAGFGAPLGVFRDYLEMFTDQWAACDVFSQESPEFESHLGIVRVPECAEVLIEHRVAMVEWVEAGMPTG